MADQYLLTAQPPSVPEHRALRDAVGWGNPMSAEATGQALRGSLAVFTVRLGGDAVAVARIIGDGGAAYYIQDVIVHPAHQGRGLGRRLMEAVIAWLDENTDPGAFVGLMAAGGKEAFYERFGFAARPRPADGHVHGAGMERIRRRIPR